MSNFDRFYIRMWFEFWNIECKFMLGMSKLVKMDKMVKSQKIDFWLWLNWSNDHIALGLKLVGKSNILLDNSINT